MARKGNRSRCIRYLEVNMNAAHKHTNSLNPASDGVQPLGLTSLAIQEWDAASSLSALVDGEVHDTELERLLADHLDDGETLEAWHGYQVIGDVLRASAPAAANQAPQAFLAGFHARLQAEVPRAQPLPEMPVWTETPTPLTGHVRAPAANDAVFRWKMVAGLASLAAVMAVSWTVLGTTPIGAGSTGGAGAQMALTRANPGTAPVQTQDAMAVVVNTPQGPLIRDAQLEALMAEHRQYGGMSALQMPAGFLRNATYEATGR